MITMSSLPRLLACNGSVALPRAEVASFWAKLGNEDHEDLSDLQSLPAELAKHVPAGARSEVKVAYDVVSGEARIIGEGGGRGYGTLAPFEIAGSIDVLGVDGDTVVVVDWKTGYNEVEPASSNGQLWGYALAACRALGKSNAIVRIVYTKTGRFDEYAIDELELSGFAARVGTLHERAGEIQAAYKRGEVPATNEGTWCRYCPSKTSCPSKNALLVQLAGRGLSVVGDATMTTSKAATAVLEFQRIEQLVKDVRGRLTAYVDEFGPIDLGNGKAYGRYVRKGDERLDGGKTLQVIRELSLEEDQRKLFERTALETRTSKAALKRAAEAIGQQPKFAAMVVDRVRAAGGITNASPERPIGEFTIGKGVAAAPPPEFPIELVNKLLAEAG